MNRIIISDQNKCSYTPYYSYEEHSFFTLPNSPCDYSISLGKTQFCLDVSAVDNIICCLNGYSNEKKWIKKQLEIPKSQQARLIFDVLDQPIKGIGLSYPMGSNIYFDSNMNTLCICDDVYMNYNKYITIEFNENTYATIQKNQIIAIWIKPLFVK